MTSRDYDEKIHQLFEEGKKLGAPGINTFSAISNPSLENCQPPVESKPKIDVLALEKEFDFQAKEADRLQQELNTARDNIQKTGRAISDGLRNSTTIQPILPQSYLFNPIQHNANSNNNNMSNNLSNEVSVLTNTKIHLENALEDSQAQVEYLTSKLDSMKRSMEEQKERFRLAVEELQTKLHETVAGRKKLIELRQHDMQKQEETIHRLQATLKELAASNQMQEQALLDAHERMEILENRNQSNERALTHVRSVISSAANKNPGKSASFLNSENIAELVPELLVDNLERFLAVSTEDADALRSKLLQLEAELNASKQTHEAERLLASSDAAEVVSNMKIQHERDLEAERAKCKEAEDSLTLLTNQMKELQVDSSTQSRLLSQSRDQINELTDQLDDLRRVHCSDKGDFQSKMVCFEYDLKLEKDKNRRLDEENQAYKASVTELNHRLHQLSGELNSEKEMRVNLTTKESNFIEDIHEMRRQLDEKSAEVSRLREIAAQLRGDLNTKVAKEINEAENAQRLKADERISALSSENVGLREDLSRVKASLEAVERQLTDVISERNEAMRMAKEKDKQVDRLTSQLSLSDRKLIESTEARKNIDEKLRRVQSECSDLNKASKQSNSDIERLKSIVDEKERVVLQLRHQVESKSELLRTSNKNSDEAEREGTILKMKNQGQEEEIERLRTDLKAKEEGLVDYERRMRDLVEEKEKIVRDVHGIERQISNLIEAKKEADDELKETRAQLSRLIEERDELSKELKSTRSVYEEDVKKLGRELNQKHEHLRSLQEAIRNVKNIDDKAAQMASNMQKEVTDKRGVIDALQTELANICDKLEIAHRQNKQYKKENTKLQQNEREIEEKLKRTEQELRDRTKTEKGFKLAVERLEVALEKAAERNAAAQSVISRQEAELSRNHIRRNLDMMDKRIPGLPFGTMDERNPATGATNAFSRPPIPPNNNTILQNMMARILATMATSHVRSDDVTPSLPVHLVPASGRQSEARANLSTDEIYKILTEVREQLAQQKLTSCDVKKQSQRHKSKRRSARNDSLELPVVFVNSDVTPATSDTSDVTLPNSATYDFVLTSSPFKERGTTGVVRPPSPVSLLLAGGDSTQSLATKKHKRRSNHLSPIKNSGDPFSEVGEDRDKLMKDAISDNAEELCRQLQSRLEGLTKIGGKLEKQNKMEAKLMRKQDEKLKRIRENENLWR